jgi:hypothetical protein
MKGKNCNHCGAEIQPGVNTVVCEEHYKTATTSNIRLERERAELLDALHNTLDALERATHIDKTRFTERAIAEARAAIAKAEGQP